MDPALRPMIIYERFESGGPLQKVRCPSPPTPSFSPGYSTHIVTVVLAELVLQVAQPTMVKVVALQVAQPSMVEVVVQRTTDQPPTMRTLRNAVTLPP